MLARLLWVLLQRAGREADRLMRARFAAERAAATAAARRSAQRAHWATVHDTSASTLLMIGLGAVRGTEEWLPGQVRRDIALLDGARDGPLDGDVAEVALDAALREVSGAARVPVAVDCPAGVTAPTVVVRAMAGAAAEALENVARHARVDGACVQVRPRGRIRGSSRSPWSTTAWGSTSTPSGRTASGSRCPCTTGWPPWAGARRWSRRPGAARSCGCGGRRDQRCDRCAHSADDERPYLALALLHNLRVARSVIVLVILSASCCPTSSPTCSVYHPLWTGRPGSPACSRSPPPTRCSSLRHRTWGRARWPVAAFVLALSVWATALLPPWALVGPPHQTLGAVGWFGVLLLADTGLAALLGFLGCTSRSPWSSSASRTASTCSPSSTSRSSSPRPADSSWPSATAGAALDRVADAATEAARRQAATVTAEEVARQLHDDREERYGRLRDSVLPLLRGIGEGTLSPADPDVQRRAALEAARLRRLFAEESDVADLLAAELGSLVDILEQRGIEVSFSATGQRTVPPPAARTRAGRRGGPGTARGPPIRARDGERGGNGSARRRRVRRGRRRRARCDAAPDVSPEISTVVVGTEQQTWVEVRWSPSAS